MAPFNAEIALRLKTEQLDRELKRVERAIGKLGAADKAIPRKLTDEYNKINKQLDLATAEVLKRGKAEATNTRELKRQSAELRKQKANRRRGAQSAALGVGFPLLFGGGAGSIAGGLLGSAGGFGGQILGSAIGQQIDNAVQGIAKLGQALNPLTADIDAVVKAVGESGTEFEKLVKELEKAAGAEAALATVTDRLAIIIGQNGVNALTEFGDETALLGNTFAVTLTQIGAAVAELINKSGILNSVIAKLAFDNDLRAGLANTTDPTLQRLRQERQSFIDSQGGIVREEDIQPYKERIVLRQQELALQERQTIEARARQQIEQARATQEEDTLGVLRAKVELAESGLNLSTEEGFKLAEKLTLRKIDKRETELIAQNASKETRDLERQLALLDLKNRKKEADRRAEEEARREAESAERKRQAAFDKARRGRAAILQEVQKQTALDLKLVEQEKGRQAAINDELIGLQNKLAIQVRINELTIKDVNLRREKLETLKLELELRQNILNLEAASLRVQERLTALQGERVLKDVTTDISRQIEDANRRPTGNTFGDEQADLRVDQLRRELDIRTDLNRQIQDQTVKIEELSKARNAAGEIIDPKAVERAINQRKNLEDQVALYDQLLPQLNQAEQAQLRYNQVLQAAQPYAEALATGLTQGLRDVVAGTKTAEEAFASFLNNIADLLIQTAATMIAQYIAIGIARKFAGIGDKPDNDGPPPLPEPEKSPYVPGAGGGLTSLFFRASGGPVARQNPYIVGENGAELFIPNVSGRIVPADDFEAARASMGGGGGGNSSTVDGAFDASTSSISSVRERLIQNEIKATSAKFSSDPITFETYQIGSMDVVTREEAEAIGQASAQQARAQVFNDMRNRPAIRRQIGVK